MSNELPESKTRNPRWNSFRVREWLHTLISPGDSTHELALGAAIGMFVAFTPLLGLHLVIIVFVAFLCQRLVRFNKAIAIATCYVNNPFTFAPMLWASYKVGAWLMPSTAEVFDPEKVLKGLDWRHGFQAVPKFLHGIGLPMLVGCLLLGVVTAAVTYPLMFAFVTWYRRETSVPNLKANSESDVPVTSVTPESNRPS